jgi:hypothetical protein
MQAWLASRQPGDPASRELSQAAPALRAAYQSRCAREERVLVHMMARRDHAAAIGEYLPLRTWTADLRYDLAGALADVAKDGGGRWGAGAVQHALRGRLALIAASHLDVYSGPELGTALAYLARLEAVMNSAEDAEADSDDPAGSEVINADVLVLHNEDLQAERMVQSHEQLRFRREAARIAAVPPVRRWIARQLARTPGISPRV